jgi:hypothetical protein
LLIAHARRFQPVHMLNRLVAPLATFTGVAVIDATLPEVRYAAYQAATVLDIERAAHVAETADGFGGIEFPGMHAELAVGQRTHWTDRDTHAAMGAGGIAQVRAVGRADFGFQPPTQNLDGGNADYFITNPGTTCTDDAAVPFVIDEVTEMDILLGQLWSLVRVRMHVVKVGVVLQVALTRFVTGRTVQGVIHQIHLQYELA